MAKSPKCYQKTPVHLIHKITVEQLSKGEEFFLAILYAALRYRLHEWFVIERAEVFDP
ncbi:MAG: hypothetical protein LDL41_11995 [Coleofasciculus sp. S288]|nr:hypothetical protein [Coleofasciculus sp. S288]